MRYLTICTMAVLAVVFYAASAAADAPPSAFDRTVLVACGSDAEVRRCVRWPEPTLRSSSPATANRPLMDQAATSSRNSGWVHTTPDAAALARKQQDPSSSAGAQGGAELARKLQDPLANLRVLNTENNLDFGTGDEALSMAFNVQPVYAISLEKINITLRGVIPVVGLAPEAQKPVVGEPLPSGETIWGLADSQFMAFFSLKSESKFKWGLGPVISVPTATDPELSGAGWGGGPALIVVGSFGSHWTYAAIGTHVEGQDGYSTSSLQPMLFYNVPDADGLAINYNAVTTYNHNATRGNEWTVPLGLSVSKPFVFESGHALDVSIGAYINVVKPDGAADWTFRWTLGLVFP